MSTAWLREGHQPVATRAQVVVERKVEVTTRYVRPRPRVKIVKVPNS